MYSDPKRTDSRAGIQPNASGAWRAVFIMQFLYIIAMIDRNLISLMVGPIKQSLQISDFQISLLQGTAFGLFYATCGLLTGWLLDRFSRRKVVYWGISLWSVCAASCGLARTYGQLMLARFGVGAGEAVLSPASYAMLSMLFPRERLGFAIGVYGIGAILGGAISLSLGGMVIAWMASMGSVMLPIIGEVEPWQATFILFGLPGIVIAPIVFLISSRADRPAVAISERPHSTFGAFLRVRRAYLTWHFFGFGLVTLLAYGHAAWFPTYLVRHFHLNMAAIGNILALSTAIGGVAGFLSAGAIADRWFGRGTTDAHFRYALIATLALTVVGVCTFLVNSLVISIIFAGICYMLFSISGLAAAHLQIITPPELRARTSALYLFVINVIGLCTGPSMVAAFTDFLFRNPDRVGSSLMLTYAIFGPLAVTAFWMGRAPARQAVADSL
ncbi:MFS family permease [Sphingobium wenxiniae]|uniref:Nitrate/nitrite transporter NarK n=1 Tax=Sphingobium wenxiniae (strain DSM 21828 / CGMCC 1.7748 / JZ-1) TaxID=595605 RepID=A0A562K7T0_SPHWJ|nr:MFS transporter [Sphingobium wenxiniae]MBB6192681.1 MFS family permease [Sphingobium wenxiniae]TWH91478.1 nitrate/nitrite transporter NarK [Sphingobium wenxiniae]